MNRYFQRAGWVCLLFIPFSLIGQTTGTFRVVHYNLLQFGNTCGNVTVTQKYSWLADILNHARPDIFTVNEIAPSAVLARGIRQISFAYTDQMEYAPFTNTAGSDIINMLFYNKSLFGFKSVEVIGNSIRDIDAYKMYLKPEVVSTVDTLWFYIIVAHLKAGSTTADQNARNVSAQQVRTWTENLAPGYPVIMNGDFNVSTAAETAWQTLVLQGDTFTRFNDPINKQNGWAGAGNALYHTQSTRLSSTDCGSGSGMDDRFDFILMNRYLKPGFSDIEALTNTYQAVGNDGNSYDQELTCTGTGSVSTFVCGRLKLMSDHLPVMMDFAYPALNEIDPLKGALYTVTQSGPSGLTLSRLEDQSRLEVAVYDLNGRVLGSDIWERTEPSITLDHLPAGQLLLIQLNDLDSGKVHFLKSFIQTY